jgi:hypothetical protein
MSFALITWVLLSNKVQIKNKMTHLPQSIIFAQNELKLKLKSLFVEGETKMKKKIKNSN